VNEWLPASRAILVNQICERCAAPHSSVFCLPLARERLRSPGLIQPRDREDLPGRGADGRVVRAGARTDHVRAVRHPDRHHPGYDKNRSGGRVGQPDDPTPRRGGIDRDAACVPDHPTGRGRDPRGGGLAVRPERGRDDDVVLTRLGVGVLRHHPQAESVGGEVDECGHDVSSLDVYQHELIESVRAASLVFCYGEWVEIWKCATARPPSEEVSISLHLEVMSCPFSPCHHTSAETSVVT